MLLTPGRLGFLESSKLEHPSGIVLPGQRPQPRTKLNESLKRPIRRCPHGGAAHFLD